MPSESSSSAPRSNPFSTRFIRPGALPFIFPEADTISKLVETLAANHWRGQILGPHGSGKSTLLAQLATVLTAQGRVINMISLHDGQRALPHGWQQQAKSSGTDLLLVDGYEQLGHWHRWRLRRICSKHAWGLVVTSHTDVHLPLLWQTVPDLATTQAVVAALTTNTTFHIPLEVIEQHFNASGANLRETLFRLYDYWEKQHRPEVATDSAD